MEIVIAVEDSAIYILDVTFGLVHDVIIAYFTHFFQTSMSPEPMQIFVNGKRRL